MDIFILLLLILFNGIFAMSEIAVVSSRKVRLQQWADDGHKGAQAALQLAEEPTRFLSTVQIGITSISILSGVYGEEALSEHLREWLNTYPVLAPHSHALSVVLMVLFITTLSLVLGELVPKRLAMHNPERIAATLSRPMLWLSRLSAPLVKLLSRVTDRLLYLIGVRQSNEPSITEEEIKVLIEQGTDEGVFDQVEQALVKNIFQLDDRKVASIMTPRKEIMSIDIEDSQEKNCNLLRSCSYARFPVCKGSMEHIIGVLNTKRMLDRLLSGQPIDFTADLRPPLYVPATISLMQLLAQFKAARTHLGLVVDEYGELEGLVTINDVMEAIVGDMPASTLEEDDEIVQRDDGSWLVDGLISLVHFKEFFKLEALLPGEETGNIHTLGGIIMYQLGRVPVVTDRLEWNGFTFEVMDMDKTRVDKVMVVRQQDMPAITVVEL